MTKLDGQDFGFDVGLDPLDWCDKILIGPGNVLAGQVLFELGQDCVVDFEVLVDGAVGQVVWRKVEEDIVDQQRILERSGLGGINLLVRGDTAAAIYGTSAVGELDFLVGAVGRQGVGVIVVVVERDAVIVALNQAARMGCSSGRW